MNTRLKSSKMKADKILTKSFFELHYYDKNLSFPEIRKILIKQYNITLDTRSIWARAKKHEIQTRTKSEANILRSTCDYTKTFITEKSIEAIDGFLLGDGGIRATNSCAALHCCVKHEEFCNYLMSFFENYYPSVKKYTVQDKRIKGGKTTGYRGRTKYHPDIWNQYKRWYKKGVKIVPKDVRITPLSVLVWYLGDGSFRRRVGVGELTLCTHGFSDKDRSILVKKLRDVHVYSSEDKQGALKMQASSILVFFNLIGWFSPVQCYKHKFSCNPQLKGLVSLRHPDTACNNKPLIRKHRQDWIKDELQRC